MLSVLLSWFKLVHGLFGQSNIHSTFSITSQEVIVPELNSSKDFTSVRPKFGISYSIGQKYWYQYRSQFFVSQTETPFFQILLFFPNSWGNTSSYKLENKPSPSKIIQKYLIFGRKFGFRGPYMMKKKNTSCYQ